MNNIPIITLEVERMHYALRKAMHEHSLLMDQELQKAIDNFCTRENIASIISRKSHEVMHRLIDEELERFFENEGRKIIKKAVIERLAGELKGDDMNKVDEYYLNLQQRL